MRNHLPELEEHFTVVTWDQRGTGKSYDELDPTDTYTLDGVVDDTIAVTNHLRDRFDQDRIYLLGQSWGSTLGVLAVQQQPELYAAFIGVGQMVSQLATDTIFYDDTLDWAQANGDTGLVDDLTSIGPPPYDRMLDYETALSYEHEVYPYDHSTNAEGEGGFSENFIVSEYTLIDQVHLLGAFMDTFSVLYPQLQDIDFRQTATEFDIPMFFVQGAHEADGRADVFDDWYPMIDAPIKDVTVLDTSGHRPLFEQPDEFVDYMVDTVLADTTDQQVTSNANPDACNRHCPVDMAGSVCWCCSPPAWQRTRSSDRSHSTSSSTGTATHSSTRASASTSSPCSPRHLSHLSLRHSSPDATGPGPCWRSFLRRSRPTWRPST